MRGLDDGVTVARDGRGVPGIFASTLHDLGFGMGWACAEDRLFQIELTRRALRGELAATFGDRPVDEKQTTRMMSGRTFVDLDAFTRAMDFRAAAEASFAIASPEARAWSSAFASGINAYIASGRRPLEMLLLDLEPSAWSGADTFLVGKGIGFQLSFSYRFALAWALVGSSVDRERAEHLRPVRHPFTITRGDAKSIAPVLATTEALRSILGSDGLHLGSNAFAVAPERSANGRAMVASDPHMPLTAPSVFWEVRLKGADLDVRGVCIPGFPAIVIGQNAQAAWGMTAGWGDDTQIYREDVEALSRDGRLKHRREEIAVKNQGSRPVTLYETPRGPAILCLAPHVRRLFDSSRVMRMDMPYSFEQVSSAIVETVRRNGLKSGYIRPLAYKGVGPIALDARTAPTELVIFAFEFG
ncbi:MAG: penicillin acylase family protein, partial [Polyangiales bacterium]